MLNFQPCQMSQRLFDFAKHHSSLGNYQSWILVFKYNFFPIGPNQYSTLRKFNIAPKNMPRPPKNNSVPTAFFFRGYVSFGECVCCMICIDLLNGWLNSAGFFNFSNGGFSEGIPSNSRPSNFMCIEIWTFWSFQSIMLYVDECIGSLVLINTTSVQIFYPDSFGWIWTEQFRGLRLDGITYIHTWILQGSGIWAP